MAPLVEAFDARELTSRTNNQPDGKTRKPQISDLKNCDLKELLQYNCDLNGPTEDPRSQIICQPVLRLFRQCANGLTVETTAWEGRFDGNRDAT